MMTKEENEESEDLKKKIPSYFLCAPAIERLPFTWSVRHRRRSLFPFLHEVRTMATVRIQIGGWYPDVNGSKECCRVELIIGCDLLF